MIVHVWKREAALCIYSFIIHKQMFKQMFVYNKNCICKVRPLSSLMFSLKCTNEALNW